MFTNFLPISQKLKRYVSSFTVSQKEGVYPVKYKAYPNLGNCVAFFNQTKIQIRLDEISFSKDEKMYPEIIILGRLTSPTLVTYNNPVEEISINFTPCGINYFFKVPFSKLAGQSHQLLTEAKWTNFAFTRFQNFQRTELQYWKHLCCQT